MAIVGNLHKCMCLMIFGSECFPQGRVKIVAKRPFLSSFLHCTSSSCWRQDIVILVLSHTWAIISKKLESSAEERFSIQIIMLDSISSFLCHCRTCLHTPQQYKFIISLCKWNSVFCQIISEDLCKLGTSHLP